MKRIRGLTSPFSIGGKYDLLFGNICENILHDAGMSNFYLVYLSYPWTLDILYPRWTLDSILHTVNGAINTHI